MNAQPQRADARPHEPARPETNAHKEISLRRLRELALLRYGVGPDRVGVVADMLFEAVQ